MTRHLQTFGSKPEICVKTCMAINHGVCKGKKVKVFRFNTFVSCYVSLMSYSLPNTSLTS